MLRRCRGLGCTNLIKGRGRLYCGPDCRQTGMSVKAAALLPVKQCAREGCTNEVLPRRRKYCSEECYLIVRDGKSILRYRILRDAARQGDREAAVRLRLRVSQDDPVVLAWNERRAVKARTRLRRKRLQARQGDQAAKEWLAARARRRAAQAHRSRKRRKPGKHKHARRSCSKHAAARHAEKKRKAREYRVRQAVAARMRGLANIAAELRAGLTQLLGSTSEETT